MDGQLSKRELTMQNVREGTIVVLYKVPAPKVQMKSEIY